MSRFKRLMQLVRAISRQDGRIDADELTLQLGVSRRTIFRDIATLRNAGVLIRFDRPAGQYALEHSSLIDPLPSPDDLVELLLHIALPHYPRTTSSQERAKQAAKKLSRTLPGLLYHEYSNLVGRLDSITEEQVPSHTVSAADAVIEGLKKERALVIQASFTPNGPPDTRVVHPVSVRRRHSGWQLCGVLDPELTTLLIALDQVRVVSVLDEPSSSAAFASNLCWDPAEVEIL